MDLKVLTLNSRGWLAKYEEINHLLTTYRVAIFAGQETWWSENNYRARLDRYQIIETKAKEGAGKLGKILGLRRNLGLSLSEYKSCEYFVSGIISGKCESGEEINILGISVYIPCGGQERHEALELVRGFLNGEYARGRNRPIIVLGNFNMPSHSVDIYIKSLSFELERLNNEPAYTWRGSRGKKSNLDHILVHGLSTSEKTTVLMDIDTSDHFPVLATLKCRNILESTGQAKLAVNLLRSKRGLILNDPSWRLPDSLELSEEAQVFIDTVWEVANKHKVVKGLNPKQEWRTPLSKSTIKKINERRLYFKLQGTPEFDESTYQRLWYECKREIRKDRIMKAKKKITQKLSLRSPKSI